MKRIFNLLLISQARLPQTFVLAIFFVAIASANSHAQQPEAEDRNFPDADEIEEIIVQATRSQRRLQDQPIRVEVVHSEELEEKLLDGPGNISMLLSETGGLRVQVTSPALGAANISVQGMRGRYTQLLADGLPLYGGQASSLGLLQIPPSDLRQVEVIKGSSSALYGGQALGGVINLVSKRPGDEAEGEIIFNATTQDGQDISTYGSMPFNNSWSGSLLSSCSRQTLQDLDDDGWIDVPYFERWSVRPRLFWESPQGANMLLTFGAMTEDRQGGTLANSLMPDGQPFPKAQDTNRFDSGLVIERPVAEWGTAQFRASGMRQTHRHQFGNQIEKDRHQTLLTELSLAGDLRDTTWVGGLAYQLDDYRSETFSAFDYTYKAPAVFVQLDHDFATDISVALSARWDKHSEYGDRVSPRLSLLYRPGNWTIRASWGQGFFAPTPFVEEIEAAGLSRLQPLDSINAETAQTASLDLGYTSGSLEAGLTMFGSEIENAVRLQTVTVNSVQLINADGITRTRGVEALLRWRRGYYTFAASYLYVDADEPNEAGTGRRPIPLTPKHSAGITLSWEQEDRGRVGFEAFYNGSQPLENNPYRTAGKSYLEVGLLGEMVLGRYRVYLNLENLLNVRQTREDSLLLPSRTPDGRWTVDAWAPLEGFVANAGVRIQLGEED